MREFVPVFSFYFGKVSRLTETACGKPGEGPPGCRLPGEMKKVLHNFLSLVTSRISLVMLTILPATGGTRRKSRILAGK